MKYLKKLTALYRERGQVLTRVVIPDQEFEANIVNFHLVPGYINKVTMEGDKTLYNDRIKKNIERILQNRPLTWSAYAREILLVNDLLGIKATLVNSKDNPASADLVLELEKTSVRVFADINNSGTKTLGPWQYNGLIQVNDLVGVNEAIYLERAASSNMKDMSGIFWLQTALGVQWLVFYFLSR